MGITLTVFLGARDPGLIWKLNQCKTNFCLIDPENVDKFIDSLPAFTINQTESILAYTLNIFRQFSFPDYAISLEEASGQRQKSLDNCRQKLVSLLDRQLDFLVSRRSYRELFLHNSLINIVATSTAYHLSDVKVPEGVPLVVVLDDSPGTITSLKNIKHAITVAPLSLTKSLHNKNCLPGIAVTNNPVIAAHRCLSEFLIMDMVANPFLALTKSQLIRTCSDAELKLSPFVKDSLKERMDAYATEEEFTLQVAAELGAEKIFVSGAADQSIYKKFTRQNVELLALSELPSSSNKLDKTLILPSSPTTSIFPKKILNKVAAVIEKEPAESDVFQALIRAAEYQAVIKLMNGWVSFQTINQVQENMALKKKGFLELIKQVKSTIIAGNRFSQIKLTKLLNSLPHRCIKSDLLFEHQVLLQANPILAQDVMQVGKTDYPKDIKINYAAATKLDLYVKKNAQSWQYHGYGMAYLEARYAQVPAVNLVIITGLMDGQLQLMCLNFFPQIPIMTMEPRATHLAQVIDFMPLISIMGRQGIWLYGSTEELANAYRNIIDNKDIRPLVLDADPQSLRNDLADLKKLMKIDFSESNLSISN